MPYIYKIATPDRPPLAAVCYNNTIQYNNTTIQYNTIIIQYRKSTGESQKPQQAAQGAEGELYCIVLYCICKFLMYIYCYCTILNWSLYCIELDSLLYGIVAIVQVFSIVLDWIVAYCIVLYCIVLCCVVLY